MDLRRRCYRAAVHLSRLLLLALIIGVIHWNHRQVVQRAVREGPPPLTVADVRPFFATADHLTAAAADGEQVVLDPSGASLGVVLQTSPAGDRAIGFSGPTNMLLAFDTGQRLLGVRIQSSRDTREHVEQVRRDAKFLDAYRGLTRAEAGSAELDAVSGATLTSLAIQEAIVRRLGGARPLLRFPTPPTLADVRPLFPEARALQAGFAEHVWHVIGSDGSLGTVIRNSPAADDVIGYQGPTDVLIGLDGQGRVVGVVVRGSFDNDPYVGYIRDDDYFRGLWNGQSLEELAGLAGEGAEVEGVSGATLTSQAIAEGVFQAAEHHLQQLRAAREAQARRAVRFGARDAATAMIIVLGALMGLTSLRANGRLRVAYQLLLIGVLGLYAGNLLSMAMFVGWSESGIPWRTAPGLVLLTAAAVLLPIAARRNLYCTHLCPHGAAQQLLKRRLRWQWKMPRRVTLALRVIPALLLGWCVVVSLAGLAFRLVDIEPFDAWVPRIAGPATITIAVAGLAFSLFVPMGYCRFGCPTGALLGYLRYHSRSERWTRRDWVAVTLAGLGTACLLL